MSRLPVMQANEAGGAAAPPPEAPPRGWRRLASLVELDLLVRAPALGAAIFLVVLLAVFGVLAPAEFMTASNLRNIAIDASTLLILAVGMTLVIASGGIDLSVGSVLAFAGVVGVKAMVAVGGGGVGTIAVGLLVCLACGAGWGLINGLLIAKARLSPLIVTLGTFAGAFGAALIVSDGQDLNDVPSGLVDHVGYGLVLGQIPATVLIALGVAAVAGIALALTRFGRYTLVIGSNEEAARRGGIDVARHRIKLYMWAGTLAGFAGFVSLARFSSTTINGHQADNLNAIVGTVIGGTSLFGGVATMLGTVIGTLIPSVFNNGFTIVGLSSYWQQLATGAVLIAVVWADQVRRERRMD